VEGLKLCYARKDYTYNAYVKKDLQSVSTEEVQLTPETIYETIAEIGFKRYFHLGGSAATQELIESSAINAGSFVLEVGCATGRTTCYLAKHYGSRVVGVDLLPGMVREARQRTREARVEALTEFRVADAQDLPFADETFEVVIGEFITGLLVDKARALRGYLRVLKPGGTLALNEALWVQTPPPPGMDAFLRQVFGVHGGVLDLGTWQQLLDEAGVKDLKVRTGKVERLSNPWEDLADVVRSLPKVIQMYRTSPVFRKFFNVARSLPEGLLDYFGYGLFIGTK
jgi:arsenite methyltransferase